MRRAAIWAGVVALAALAAGTARWPVAPSLVADALNAKLGGSGPLTWLAPKVATFSALPWPALHIVDARLDEAPGFNVVSAPEARVELSLTDLMLGRVAPRRVTFAQPTIALDLDRPPFTGRLDPADVVAAISGFASLGSVSLTEGVVRVTSRTRRLDTVIESLRGGIEGLKPGSRMSVNLSAVWRDTPFVVSGSLDDPQRAAHGRPSALSVMIASSLGDLTFRGALIAGASASAAGELSVSSHALSEAARLFGVKPPPNLGAAALAISGKVKATPTDVVFDEATVTTAGQTLEGALRMTRTGGRLAVSGSLDAQRLTLAPLFGPPAPLSAPSGGWSDKAFSVAPARDFDLDLRLSAGQLDVYGVLLENAAASALLKNGALTATLVDATAFGGRLAGELHMACDHSTLQIAARAKLADADLGLAASDFGLTELTGRGAAEFAVETAGRSPAEAVAGLGGKASLKLVDGAVSGVNLEEALRRSQRRPLDIAKDMRSGGTPFEQAALEVVIGSGVAHVVNGALVARGVKADLQGAIDFAARSLNLRVDAAQAEPPGDAPSDAARLSLDIDGPWSNPTVRTVDETDSPQPSPGSTTP